MKRKLLSLMLVGAMATSMVACGSSADTTENASGNEEGAATTADVQSDDENTLTVYAWDENFNIPALEAAEKDYKDVNPDFKLEIITQSQSSDVEQAITLAAEAGDYSTLPDIVLFQDHYFQQFYLNPTVYLFKDQPVNIAVR